MREIRQHHHLPSGYARDSGVVCVSFVILSMSIAHLMTGDIFVQVQLWSVESTSRSGEVLMKSVT